MWSRTDQPAGGVVDILMYHSISGAGGPTSIPEPVFRAQMQAVAEAGTQVISLDDLLAWKTGARELTGPAIALTFDDGFEDFATSAWPIIRDHGWPVTVFLPTGHMGGPEDWRGASEPPRTLMSWDMIAALSNEGADFGGHSISHPDLSTIAADALEQELLGCRETIKARTGRDARHFAPPYGLNSDAARTAISRHFETSCGTRFGRADAASDLFDLPRLEMFYFTDPARWRAHLAGRGAMYLSARKTLRKIREAVSKPWQL